MAGFGLALPTPGFLQQMKGNKRLFGVPPESEYINLFINDSGKRNFGNGSCEQIPQIGKIEQNQLHKYQINQILSGQPTVKILKIYSCLINNQLPIAN